MPLLPYGQSILLCYMLIGRARTFSPTWLGGLLLIVPFVTCYILESVYLYCPTGRGGLLCSMLIERVCTFSPTWLGGLFLMVSFVIY